jgi:hypothetical protein
MDPAWNEMAMIERLAGGDITKFDAVFKTNWIMSLDLMAYWKERDKYHAAIERRQKMMK